MFCALKLKQSQVSHLIQHRGHNSPSLLRNSFKLNFQRLSFVKSDSSVGFLIRFTARLCFQRVHMPQHPPQSVSHATPPHCRLLFVSFWVFIWSFVLLFSKSQSCCQSASLPIISSSPACTRSCTSSCFYFFSQHNICFFSPTTPPSSPREAACLHSLLHVSAACSCDGNSPLRYLFLPSLKMFSVSSSCRCLKSSSARRPTRPVGHFTSCHLQFRSTRGAGETGTPASQTLILLQRNSISWRSVRLLCVFFFFGSSRRL